MARSRPAERSHQQRPCVLLPRVLLPRVLLPPRARRHAVVSAEVLSLVKQEAGPQLTVRVGWREG